MTQNEAEDIAEFCIKSVENRNDFPDDYKWLDNVYYGPILSQKSIADNRALCKEVFATAILFRDSPLMKALDETV
jgi:hypothetical protein